MLDNHLSRTDVDGFRAYALGFNASSGPAFQGIDRVYRTAWQKVRNVLLVVLAAGGFITYLFWAAAQNSQHLS